MGEAPRDPSDRSDDGSAQLSADQALTGQSAVPQAGYGFQGRFENAKHRGKELLSKLRGRGSGLLVKLRGRVDSGKE